MYVKLFSGILDSSLWELDSDMRIVWITLLAMCDPDGIVRASESGVARRAVVSPEKTAEALKLFQSPDADSRSTEHEGRRLERIDGGFMILNYKRYRQMRDAAQERENSRVRMRKMRERKREASDNHDAERYALLRTLRQEEGEEEAEEENRTPLPPTDKRVGGEEVDLFGEKIEDEELPAVTVKELSEEWNAVAAKFGFRKVQSVSSRTKRYKSAHARLKDPNWLKMYPQALAALKGTDFLVGKNPRGWVADFDWFCRQDTVYKILEGNYGLDGKGKSCGMDAYAEQRARLAGES